jgi:uncharacterized protein
MKNSLDKYTVTFIVTEECNFRCKYCYMVHKNKFKKMPFSVAKETIDLLIGNRDKFPTSEVIWEFIGGEPLLEIDLIEKIADYAHQCAFEHNHPWFESSMFSLSSNGSLYGDPRFQKLLDRYPNRFSVGMTIDGPAHVHNLERIFSNGKGTHASVLKNVPLWLSRAHNQEINTKVTISHNTLPTISESVLYLFSIGIQKVNINVVFENVWEPGDDEILEEQLDKLGKQMIDLDLWPKHQCSFFSELIGHPIPLSNDRNWCGAGKYMLAVDADGLFFPCVRFADFSLAKSPGLPIGNCRDGIDPNKLAPFLSLSRSCQSSKECMECEVASGCAWCQGFNYDDSGVLNHRATYICEMHKARVRANNRFWERIKGKKNGS